MRQLDVAEVASRIRACRAYAGLTRKELADKMGTSSSTVERWEKGHPGSLGGEDRARRQTILWEVAKVCDLDPAWAISDWDVPPSYRLQESDVRGIVGRLHRIEQALGLEQLAAWPTPPRADEQPEDVADEIEQQATGRAGRKASASESRPGAGSRDRGQSR